LGYARALPSMRPLGTALALVLPLTACSAPVVGDYAGGEVKGGEPLPWVATPCVLAPGTPGPDTSFNYLYTTFFGPAPALANCGQLGCHTDNTTNAFAVSGFICGQDKATCYTGMTQGQGGTAVSGPIVPVGIDPTKTPLYFYLAKQGTGSCGTMPKNGSYVFNSNDMATIAAWISQGAPGP
jgi:hypothetical protein